MRVYLKKVYIVSVKTTRNSAQLREAKGTVLQTDLAPHWLSNSADETYTQPSAAARGHTACRPIWHLSVCQTAAVVLKSLRFGIMFIPID